MSAFIHHIETRLPEYAYKQTDLSLVMKRQFKKDRKAQKIISQIYKQSAIETRHSVLAELNEASSFFFNEQGWVERSTKARNDLYTLEAKRLYVAVARAALEKVSYLGEVTHVITVSCTGFFAPGPDLFILQELSLAPSVERYHVGFMGCYAVFPALRMAQAFCQDENAVVLIVSVELCTLHLQSSADLDSLLSASVFADGAAAVVLSAKPPQHKALELAGFATTVVADSYDKMAWTIADTGFEMILSSYVPKILEASILQATMLLFEKLELSIDLVDAWAVHPGGRAILDRVAAGLSLEEVSLWASYEVLKDCGNMSSVTILFVLEKLLHSSDANELICAMAFGPGLTVESGLFRIC